MKKKIITSPLTTWTDSEIKALLALYLEDKDRLEKNVGVAWEMLVHNLNELYFVKKTEDDCKGEIASLRVLHKAIVDHNSRAGNDPKTCTHMKVCI